MIDLIAFSLYALIGAVWSFWYLDPRTFGGCTLVIITGAIAGVPVMLLIIAWSLLYRLCFWEIR